MFNVVLDWKSRKYYMNAFDKAIHINLIKLLENVKKNYKTLIIFGTAPSFQAWELQKDIKP